MADWEQFDHVLPCLLDRLTDTKKGVGRSQKNNPFRVGGMTVRKFQQAVLRDLCWLFNTSVLPQKLVHDYPQVARSVVNFGIRDITGICLANMDEKRLERELKESIFRFEPRIRQSSLSIKATKVRDTNSNSGNKVVVELHGILDIPPKPEDISAKTEIDLETGHFETSLV